MPLTRASTKSTSQKTSGIQPTSSIAGLGLKRKADGRTVLGEKNVNGGVRKALTARKTNLAKSNNVLQGSKKLTPKISVPETTTYTGHADFTTVPLEMWRIDLRQELIQRGKFHDQEAVNLQNPNESPHFALGIFEYMKWREEKFAVTPYFEEHPIQKGFSVQDRTTLVDWMVEFQEIQETNHETLYLAVKLADYYFSKTHVTRDKLQLVAFVAYLLASKFEERWPPTFDDMIYLSENAYTREDFIKTEMKMLACLDFDINIPTSYRYLRRYAKCVGMDMASLTCARFYLELSLVDYQFVTESQSKMAAAALWIALSTLGYDADKRQRSSRVRHDKKYWSDVLSYYTGYREFEIIDLVKRLAESVRKVQTECENLRLNNELDENDRVPKVVYNKYISDTFFMVAGHPIPSVEALQQHEARLASDRIDYEATLDPSSKRQSFGSQVKAHTSRLRKMTLRSSTSPEVVRPQRQGLDENKEN